MRKLDYFTETKDPPICRALSYLVYAIVVAWAAFCVLAVTYHVLIHVIRRPA